MIYFIFLAVLMTGVFLSPTAYAEKIVLLSGEEIAGHVIERTGVSITVYDQGAPRTIFLGEIASIDGEKAEIPRARPTGTDTAAVNKAPDVLDNYNEEDSLMGIIDASPGKATKNGEDLQVIKEAAMDPNDAAGLK